MKYLILMILFLSCYSPEKAIYDVRNLTLIEIHKTELGYDLIWRDEVKRYYQFVKDTANCNYRIGTSYLIIIPK